MTEQELRNTTAHLIRGYAQNIVAAANSFNSEGYNLLYQRTCTVLAQIRFIRKEALQLGFDDLADQALEFDDRLTGRIGTVFGNDAVEADVKRIMVNVEHDMKTMSFVKH